MISQIHTQERRRSRRISKSVPLLVRFLDLPFRIGETLQTVEVSHHGCLIQALHPFPRGTGLRLHNLQGHRTTTARVVHSDAMGTGVHLTVWTVALALDTPGDVWMVNPPPSDWSTTPEQQRRRETFRSRFNKDIHHERRG